tara:strand:- start:154 stop:384 length:231 start_codon:yes stop_codon:yes gene_type:complete
MREIETRFGKVSLDSSSFFVERVYADLIDLIEDEEDLKDRMEDSGFTILDSTWKIKTHPLADDLLYILNIQIEYLE